MAADDPIFEPWGGSPEDPPPAVPTVRWRAPSSSGPTSLPYGAAPRQSPREREPRAGARLPGTAGFLRTMAVPRLEDVAQRLRMRGHEAFVEDLLGEPERTARLRVRPWRAPFSRGQEPVEGTLELALEGSADEHVYARIWLGQQSGPPEDLERTSPARLGAAWLEGVVLDFVARVLARA